MDTQPITDKIVRYWAFLERDKSLSRTGQQNSNNELHEMVVNNKSNCVADNTIFVQNDENYFQAFSRMLTVLITFCMPARISKRIVMYDKTSTCEWKTFYFAFDNIFIDI